MAKLNAANVAGSGVELKSALVAGAAADTDIAVSGLSWKRDPKFVAAIKLEGTATYSAPDSMLDEIKRGTDDDDVQFETTASTGDHLLLIWIQNA